MPDLAGRIFHAKLGSMAEKAERIAGLARELAGYADADPAMAERAARLCKADLSTEMVGEFPELQGTMGRYYALNDGNNADVADAIAEHYAPVGPNDRCSAKPVSVAVALADKIDTLVGLFAIGEKSTGSKDPFALRRAALGVIRLIIENRLRVPLTKVFFTAAEHVLIEVPAVPGATGGRARLNNMDRQRVAADLLAFFADRLKVHLKEKGVRHDLISAVFEVGGEDDLVRLLARVEALEEFLRSRDGADLLIAYRRAANIVRIEEKKDGTAYDGEPMEDYFRQDEEKALHASLTASLQVSSTFLQEKKFNFSGAMAALARLRGPVDAFFDNVTVNCDDAELRENRLQLLSRIQSTMNKVADFSQIEGGER